MGNITLFIKDKKTLIQKIAFPLLLKSGLKKLKIPANTSHLTITKEKVYNAFMAQSSKKTLSLNKINFENFYIIRKREKKQITERVKYVIQLEYYLKK